MGPGSELIRDKPQLDDESPPPNPPSRFPSSLRLVTESQLNRELQDSNTQESDSTYGVRSLRDHTNAALASEHADQGKTAMDDRTIIRDSAALKASSRTSSAARSGDQRLQSHTAESSPARLPHHSQSPSVAHSLASLSLESQEPLSSFQGSPKSVSPRSVKPSDEESLDEAASQAIASDDDKEVEGSFAMHNSVPQLIMPSIKMPSRRPFTDRGKNLGRMKILFAGASGVGKTSLIKSIVQTCEDIVHVDPMPNAALPGVSNAARRSSRGQKPSDGSTLQISEVHASTRPYPTWWANLDNNAALRRRKSIGDLVLERNLCFVDTPGYDSSISRIDVMEDTCQYVQGQLNRSISKTGEGDVLGLLSGHGGCQVDIAFFLVARELKEEDSTFLQRLSSLTNVIVLITKSDDMSIEEVELIRRSIANKLQASNTEQFGFLDEDYRQPPFTVCSVPSEDDETMDASLLMSSEYVQPLIASELGILLQQLFEKDTVSRLRHSAASKLIKAQSIGSRNGSPISTSAISNPPQSSPSSPTLQGLLNQANSRLSPFMQARVADHMQYEEKLAQVRLAKWAADLQRSLQNERDQYHGLAQGERAVWLKQKLNEMSDNSTSPSGGTLSKIHRRRKSAHTFQYDSLRTEDPLGLFRWQEVMTQRGWLALQVAGGFGLLGALAVSLANFWSPGNHDFGWPWSRNA